MLARIQRLIVFALLAAGFAGAVFAILLTRYWLAFVVPIASVCGYAVVLAIEFWALRASYDAVDPFRPSMRDLFAAWAGESLAAPRAFLWRQPFFERAFVDSLGSVAQSRRGVVLVHGFFCNRAIWNPWLREFDRAGIPFIAVNLEPVFGSIDDYRVTIGSAVDRLRVATSLPPVVVAHSMGGLAVRAWLATRDDKDAAYRVVTIATPHAGTRMALGSRARNIGQMQIESPWLAELRSREDPAGRARFICFWSHCDNIVFPTRSATLEGADNRHLRRTAHVQMSLNRDAIAAVRELVS
ncbi:MAG: alpha/beta fold hydrolase [Caldimonas sp.]